MTYSSVSLSPREMTELGEVMEFFGTRSQAAGIRGAIKLAQHLIRTAKDRVIKVHDQVNGGFLHIEFQ